MIDNIIQDVPDKFLFIIVGLMVLYFSTRILQAKSSHIFAILVGGYIIYYLNNESKNNAVSFNASMDYKYKTIGTPKYFYIDANLINLYFSIYKWKNLNPHNYKESLKAVSNILEIEQDSKRKIRNCYDSYNIAFDQSKLALNMLHGYIYNIDNPLLIEKLKKVLARLDQLLTRHLNRIENNCDNNEMKKGKVDVHTGYIQDSNGPKAYDEYTNFNFY
jgi:hypothetical protein